MLIFAPGLLSDAALWAAQINVLKTYRTILVANYGTAATLTAMAESILHRAPPRFALVGHSMGGRVALEVMRLAPTRVTHLGLFATGCGALPQDGAGERERTERMRLLSVARTQGMQVMAEQWVQDKVHSSRRADGALLDTIVQMCARHSVEIFAAQINALLNRPDATAVLTTIACPTLLLCGAEDGVSSLQSHRDMAAAIKGSQLQSISHCGHMLTLEQPEVITALLRAWLLDRNT